MENEYINPSIEQGEEFDLYRLFQPLRQYWKRVLLIWTLTISITFFFVINKAPEFVSSGTLYISDTRGSGGTSNQLGTISDLLPEIGSNSDIESQKELLKGTDLAMKVITKLGLNAEIEGDPEYLVKRPTFWQWRQAHRNPPIYNQGLKVTQSNAEPDLYMPVEYHIQFNDGQSFILIGQDDHASSFQMGELVRTKKGSFLVSYNGQKEIMKGSEFKIKINPPGLIIEKFLSAVSVKGGGKGGQKNNLIHVSYRSGSPYTSQVFVDTLFQEFIAQSQTWATSVSRATLEFVETQEKEMRDELEKSSSVLSQFQKKSGIVSLEPQVQADLKRLVDYEVQLRNQQLKLFELTKLVESLNSGKPDQYLLVFAENPLIQNMGVKLTELSAQIASLQSQFQPGYPPLRQLRAEQKSLLAELKSTLQNDLNMARINEEQMAKTVKEYKEKFEDLPEGTKSLTEYLRSTKVYEELFLFLLQEKQKAKIAEASTLSNIRIVDQAHLPFRESSPKVPSTMMLAGILGLFVACGAVIIPALRKRRYGSVDEIKAHFPQPIFAL
ncbi:MAG TPA: GNVR domain-containing protein, partial [Nitrospiria bacterium]|nr:GNVR domain-containing protein [Nitrospiria bacterium]